MSDSKKKNDSIKAKLNKINLPKKTSKLTQQQIKFVDLFLETGNKGRSYMDAGYKAKTIESASACACALLKKPKVLEYYEKRLAEVQSKQVATADDVLLFFSRVMRGEETDAFGLDASLQDRLRGAENLAKRFGLQTVNVDIKGALPVVISGDDDLEE